MLTAIYAIVLMQAFILLIVFWLVVHRCLKNLFTRYSEGRKRRFEPHVLGLLINPTATIPLRHGLRILDKGLIEEILLEQANQLKGTDRRNMTGVFEELGYVESEIRSLRSRRWWRRLNAAINLGIIQSGDAVPALLGAVRDPVEDVRLAAVRALGELNEPRGLHVLLDALENESHWTGSSMVEVLVNMGPGIGPEIVSRLESTTNTRALRLYAQLCGLLGVHAALGSLFLTLGHPDGQVRASAAEALGRIGDPSAVESLIISLGDESREVRAEAARSLGALGGLQAIEELERALSDEDWRVRHNAASSLYQLGGKGVQVLSSASTSGKSPPSAVAAHVLAEKALGV